MCPAGSRVEGIGRPRVEASFLPDVVDRVLKVPDAASFAALHFLHRVIGRSGRSWCLDFELYASFWLSISSHAAEVAKGPLQK
jgi:hypothetical protein